MTCRFKSCRPHLSKEGVVVFGCAFFFTLSNYILFRIDISDFTQSFPADSINGAVVRLHKSNVFIKMPCSYIIFQNLIGPLFFLFYHICNTNSRYRDKIRKFVQLFHAVFYDIFYDLFHTKDR